MGRQERRIDDFREVAAGRAGLETVAWRCAGREGYLLRWTRPADEAVVVPCAVTGLHEVHLGFRGPSAFRIRLSGDAAFRRVQSTDRWDRDEGAGEEAYLCTADLTGRALELLPEEVERRYEGHRSQIAYIRLAPAGGGWNEAEHERTAGAVIDGHEALGAYCPLSPAEVHATIEAFRESTFRRIYWGCTCTSMRMSYVTERGWYLGKGQRLEDLHSEHNRRAARSLLEADGQGWDPLAELIGYARRSGMELWPSYRIQQDYPLDYPGGFGLDFTSPVFAEHQEWLQVDRHGVRSTHLFSHFHPGWEDYKLELLAEIARKGPPGIHLNLMCEAGAIWDFAPHAVERFRREYGMEPFDGEDVREEWYRFRCDHLTRFMRRLRRNTDEIAARLGSPIRIAVQVSAEWSILRGKEFGARAVSANFLHGFDIGRWAREGLVDVVAPSFRRTHRPMFLEHILEELGDARAQVELCPSLGQHVDEVFPRGYDWAVYFTDEGSNRHDLVPFVQVDPWRILREANDLYHQGADGVDVWEMGSAPDALARWNVLRMVGDRRFVAAEFGDRTGPLAGVPAKEIRFEAAGGSGA